ncbi:MAG TPA: cyclic peptide export ABC transporter [Blastocatellia bacterium]|jgi:putative ATP-binding cassette transporter|nr:cyclic peptide export ABC transporter [Blastocatellia bacterium]
MNIISFKLFGFLLKCARDIRRARAVFALVIIAGVISGISNTALLAVINSALNSNGEGTRALIRTFIGLCILLPASRFISEALLTRLTASAIYDLRVRLSAQILSAPLRLLEKIGPPRLLAALTEDIPAITAALVDVPLLVIHMSIVAGCLVYLGLLSWKVLIGVLIFMVVGIASYQLPILRASHYFKVARESWDNLFKHFSALTEGAKELKIHRRRRIAFMEQELKPTAASLRDFNITGNTIFTAARSWGQVLIFVLIGLLIFGLPRTLGTDSKTLTGYTLIFLYMMTPIEVILSMFPVLSRADVAVKKIEDIGLSLISPSADGGSSDHEAKARGWGRLELRGVTHTYYREDESNNFTLGPIDLTFSPGELVFIAGGNGSGKTTLSKLITGLYIPEEGEVLLDAQPVTDASRDDYRQLFSAVFSDFYLFESLLGLEGPATDARARQRLAELQLDHKVRVEGGVLSTTQLSQGQRKRLALLTAYLEDRPIYLFDEWAADQDPMFKDVFYLQILPELKARGKTVIVITHDDRYYRVADRVVKLDYGRVVFDRPAGDLESAPAEMIMPLGR